MFFEMRYEPFKQQAAFTKAAFATINYIATRVGKHGEEMNRILFGNEHTYTKEEAEQYISSLHMKPWRLWHVLWSPAPTPEENQKKDLDLWALARETMKYLRKHIDPNVEFIVAEHNDHTDIPHVQGLVFFHGRLSVADLMAMHAIVKQQALEQRLTLDHAITLQEKIQKTIQQERQRTRFLAQAKVLYQYSPSKQRYLSRINAPKGHHRRVKPLRLQPGCYNCGYGQKSGIPAWYDFCPCCHRALSQEKTLHLELSRQL